MLIKQKGISINKELIEAIIRYLLSGRRQKKYYRRRYGRRQRRSRRQTKPAAISQALPIAVVSQSTPENPQKIVDALRPLIEGSKGEKLSPDEQRLLEGVRSGNEITIYDSTSKAVNGYTKKQLLDTIDSAINNAAQAVPVDRKGKQPESEHEEPIITEVNESPQKGESSQKVSNNNNEVPENAEIPEKTEKKERDPKKYAEYQLQILKFNELRTLAFNFIKRVNMEPNLVTLYLGNKPTKDTLIHFLLNYKTLINAMNQLGKRRDEIAVYHTAERALNNEIGAGNVTANMAEVMKKRGLMFGDPISNFDIDAMMGEFNSKGYAGTYAINTIKTIKNIAPLSFITNTLPLNTPNIGHWVAVLIGDNHVIEYYDPLGHPPDKKMRTTLKKLINRISGPNVKYQFKVNAVPDQASNSMNCGWFAMNFLIKRYAGKTFREATNFATNNDKDIKYMQKYYHKFGKL